MVLKRRTSRLWAENQTQWKMGLLCMVSHGALLWPCTFHARSVPIEALSDLSAQRPPIVLHYHNCREHLSRLGEAEGPLCWPRCREILALREEGRRFRQCNTTQRLRGSSSSAIEYSLSLWIGILFICLQQKQPRSLSPGVHCHIFHTLQPIMQHC